MEDKETLGQDQAFPIRDVSNGMSKRFYAACVAMQGLLANPNIGNWVSNDDSLEVDVFDGIKFEDWFKNKNK